MKKENIFKRIFRAIRFKSKNYVSLYGVFEKNPSIDPDHPQPKDLASTQMISIAPSKNEAMAAVDKVIYFNHFEHYKLWCETRNLTIGCREPSWDQYKKDVITLKGYNEEFGNYSIYCMSYSPKNVATFLRVFSKTAPLLMDYEDPTELHTYLAQNSQGSVGINIPTYLYQLIDVDKTDGEKIKSIFTLLHDQPKEK